MRAIAVVVLLLISVAHAAGEPPWDILDHRYGSGDGKVSFNGSHTYLWSVGEPKETLSSDAATLSAQLPSAGFFYAVLPKLKSLPPGDITVEFKLAAGSPGTSVHVYVSDNADKSVARMNHIFQINKVYDSPVPHSIADYNQRASASNLAPAGFRSGDAHIYRLVRHDGATRVYLDEHAAPLIDGLVDGAGASGDGQVFVIGFGVAREGEASISVSHVRISSGAYPPDGSAAQKRPASSPAAIPATTQPSQQQSRAWPDELRDKMSNVGSDKQLLFDDLLFAQSEGVTFKVNPPRKTGERNVVRDRPWESATLNWLNVLRDGGKYRMWYECYDIEGWPTADDTSFCYAESTDGINWTKPALKIFEYQGSLDTNILFRSIGETGYRSRVHGTHVFKDPNAPAESRYKAVSQGVFDGVGSPPHRIAGMYSDDGLRWTRYAEPICGVFADSQYSAFFDESRGQYMLYGRVAGNGRAIGYAQSADFSHFPALSLVLQTDAQHPPESDLYNPAAMKYPFASNAYFMFNSLFQHRPDTLDVAIAVSRDGVHWTWPQRDQPFIPLGKNGEFDSGSLYMGQGLIQSGNELWQYYGGSNLTHGRGELENVRKPDGSRIFSRVISRIDGFVSAEAKGQQPASFTTIPLQYAGNILRINAQVRNGGSLRVGLIDAAGNPIPGRSVEECVAITGDQIDTLVRWKDGANVTAQSGKPTRLRMEFTDASVYAFQFSVGHAGEGRDH